MKGHIECPHTHQLGCELVALLSAYRDEDRRLFPEVYLLAHKDLLPAIAPGGAPLPIGETLIDKDAEAGARKAARMALKNCSPLAIDGWAIYVQRKETSFAYGLFRPAAQPYSIGAAVTLANSELPAAILRNSAENTVEIVNSAGARLEISLTTATPSTRAMSGQIGEFAAAACLDVTPEQREPASGYLARVLIEFLRTSHGALLVVAPAGQALDPTKFSDGVIFPEPVPFVSLMLTAVGEQSASATSLLRSHESLLRGMIMSDGITVLGTDGSIKAFRVFVHATSGTHHSSAMLDGGARTRAFRSLCGYLGAPLKACLFRSQDGRTEVRLQP